MSVTAKIKMADDDWAMSGRRERTVMQESFDSPERPDAGRTIPTSRGPLTSEEIEALLRPDLSDYDEENAADAPADICAAPVRDFPPEQADEIACEEIASHLSMALRLDCEFDAAVSLTSADTGQFRQAIGEQMQSGWAAAYIGDTNGRIRGALLLSPDLSSAFIEAACGGSTATRALKRALTPVDIALLGTLLNPLARAVDKRLRVIRVEPEPAYAALLAPPVAVTVMQLAVLSGEQTTEAALILADEGDRSDGITETATTPPLAPMQVTASLTARIATLSVPVSRLSDLKPGSTLLLGLPPDQPVELLSGGRNGALAAEGEIGRKGKRIAMRITRLGPVLRRRDQDRS